MIVANKCQQDEFFGNHFQHETRVGEMKRSLRQNWFAGQKRFRDLLGYVQCPRMMQIARIGEGDQEASIGDSSHDLAKPLRVDRSRAPIRTAPANRMKFFVFLSPRRTRSNCSRTICPCEIPVRADFSCNQVARVFGTRMVIVLPIRHNCKHIQRALSMNTTRETALFSKS